MADNTKPPTDQSEETLANKEKESVVIGKRSLPWDKQPEGDSRRSLGKKHE